MKIATYNVENLFDRAKALNTDSAIARNAIKQEAELNLLIQQEVYDDDTKERMLSLLKSLRILKTDEGPFVFLRKIRGSFLKRPRTGDVTVAADGRADWVGWIELKTEAVNSVASQNTGRVIRDVDADIIAVIEAEHRIALKQFSEAVLAEVEGKPYANIMLIDGNDDRGIDVALMTKTGYNIGMMQSHINDFNDAGTAIFSRDCPEYCVTTPQGETIWFLPNHFKSKFGGNDPVSQNKRLQQARRTAEIYKRLIAEGNENVVVLGDLNDTPDSDALKPLLQQTDLKDVTTHRKFSPGEFPGIGTFGLGNSDNKIDYLLLSPALFSRVQEAGIFRKGAWPGSRPKRWTVYDELQKEVHAASDHHLLWVQIDG